ncbi:putative glycoside hydrolase [Borrelia sp. BU AG58]|uniref:putative glycoside hydrolase n=1 Tax=Borrelia sp. BU AG58 TaxID=2887345 RepID=UPI001E56E8E0|nr:putative glycoside hydrolase [Borrelia sp. BU AG58]UER67363.1 putative glycoside hydrolase [Borrelia sp. BU AG58]
MKSDLCRIFAYLIFLFVFYFFLCSHLYPLDDTGYFNSNDLFFVHKGALYRRHNNAIFKVNPEGLETRWIYPFAKPVPKRITSVYEDFYSSNALLTTSDSVYFSHDYFKSFIKLFGRDSFNESSYITSSALSWGENKHIAIGTSNSGIYLNMDGNLGFKNLNSLISKAYLSAGYYDIISAIEFSRNNEGRLYCSYGIYGDIILIDVVLGVVKSLDFPFRKQIVRIIDLSNSRIEKLLVRTYDNHFYSYVDGKWVFKDQFSVHGEDFFEKTKRINLASNKGSIYLTAYTLRNKSAIDNRFEFIKRLGMNAVIIDFKDDSGILTYPSKLALPNKIRAVKALIDVPYILKRARKLGIYVIARIVVFKDKKLYSYNNFKYALWNRSTNLPWANMVRVNDGDSFKYIQKEHWVDLFLQDIWDYNVSIAKEIQSLGVDEIQFDYIRFPTDGPISLISSRFSKYNMRAIDALESFLIIARKNISTPISVDIYGNNGWFITNSIGQNIPMISDYVDVVSPMFYPSHYTNDFLNNELYYTTRAYKIYKEGSNRAAVFSFNRVIIRPYVQAFLLGQERSVSRETYLGYFSHQLRGIKESLGNGFSLWNSSNIYYMVKNDLSEFLRN